MLGIDVAHFASGFDDHRFPIFADDHEQQARSAERLRAMRDDGFAVIPGHDPEILQPALSRRSSAAHAKTVPVHATPGSSSYLQIHIVALAGRAPVRNAATPRPTPVPKKE